MFKLISVDLKQSLGAWRLWTLLGWLEVRQRYARSRVGPFWLTISMGVMIATIGVVYSTLFGMSMHDYLPFLSVSLVMWATFSQIVQEGGMAYINSGIYIKQASTPKLLYVLQAVWRNAVILAHNFIIVIGLLVVFGSKNWAALPLFIPALIIFMLNAMWIAMLAGLLSARFRDLPQITAAIMQIAFYVTPIIYRPESMKKFAFIVDYNPLAHLIELVRNPLIGQYPSMTNWIVTISMAVVGWIVALGMTGRYLKRIPYWV